MAPGPAHCGLGRRLQTGAPRRRQLARPTRWFIMGPAGGAGPRSRFLTSPTVISAQTARSEAHFVGRCRSKGLTTPMSPLEI